MSCEDRTAHEALCKLFETMGPAVLSREIDQPLNAALRSFQHPPSTESPQQTLIETAGRFVQHLYEHGLRPRRYLSQSCARAEAIAILDATYRTQTDTGYEAALLDVILFGLQPILDSILEAVRYRARAQFVRSAAARILLSRDWSTRRRITAMICSHYSRLFPAWLQDCNADQFVDELPELVTACASVAPWPVQ
jgi:hypothetical protein